MRDEGGDQASAIDIGQSGSGLEIAGPWLPACSEMGSSVGGQ